MDHARVGRYWEGNASAWTQLARAGWDVYRDAVNTPAFLELLPEIAGKTGLDVGCGEGHNTRLFAQRGARMFGVDIAPTFVRHASEAGGGIFYSIGSVQELPFAEASFDFATALMCLMDVPDQLLALREIHRVLRAGGFLQFSITHPCFLSRQRRHGSYFDPVEGEVDRWMFSAPAEVKAGLKPFEVPLFHRTLSVWLNSVIHAGFAIERLAEPHADEATARRVARVAGTRHEPYFLQMRCRKA